MAEAAPAAVGRGDAEVDGAARQLEDLNVGPQPPPPHLERPVAHPVITEGRRFVYFDLDTTGFDPLSHITQIAALSGQNETFSRFVRPKIPITQKAQQKRGITYTNQQMYHHDEPVPSSTITRALEDFINFLGDEPVVILGHNIKRFDCRILLNALQACNLVERFRVAVHGFVDTLSLFREIDEDLERHNLAFLYEYYVGQDFPARDARADVRALQEIVDVASPGHEAFSRHSFTFDDVVEYQRYFAARDQLLSGWKPLVTQGVVSKYMAEKAAENGLSWDTVHQRFLQEGEEAVRELLRGGLTKRQGIINKICRYLRDNPGN